MSLLPNLKLTVGTSLQLDKVEYTLPLSTLRAMCKELRAGIAANALVGTTFKLERETLEGHLEWPELTTERARTLLGIFEAIIPCVDSVQQLIDAAAAREAAALQETRRAAGWSAREQIQTVTRDPQTLEIVQTRTSLRY